MNTGNEEMNVAFHNKASACFLSASRAFEKAVVTVNRHDEEFRFQQLKKQYASSLQEDLERIAKSILSHHREAAQLNEMDKMFHQLIKDYLHRFIQKVNDL